MLPQVTGSGHEAMTVFVNYPTYVLPGPKGCLYGFAHSLSRQFGTKLIDARREAFCLVQVPLATRWPTNHTTFMYWVKQALLRKGFDVIQKRAWKDGHMLDDWVTYIRTRKQTGPYSFNVHDSGYMRRSLLKKDNRGGGMGERPGLNVTLAMQWALDRDHKEEIKLLEPGCSGAR